jgi:hypothetical protein
VTNAAGKDHGSGLSTAVDDEGDSKHLRKLPGNKQEDCCVARELSTATGGGGRKIKNCVYKV